MLSIAAWFSSSSFFDKGLLTTGAGALGWGGGAAGSVLVRVGMARLGLAVNGALAVNDDLGVSQGREMGVGFGAAKANEGLGGPESWLRLLELGAPNKEPEVGAVNKLPELDTLGSPKLLELETLGSEAEEAEDVRLGAGAAIRAGAGVAIGVAAGAAVGAAGAAVGAATGLEILTTLFILVGGGAARLTASDVRASEQAEFISL